MRKFGPGASITRHKPVSTKKEKGNIPGMVAGAATTGLTGAAQGFALGNVPGAIVGGALGILGGGYSGYKSTPEQTAKDVSSLPGKVDDYKTARELAAKAKKAADAAKVAKAAKTVTKVAKAL
jgi:outer membrane murein-binding lipoprotein Lpp